MGKNNKVVIAICILSVSLASLCLNAAIDSRIANDGGLTVESPFYAGEISAESLDQALAHAFSGITPIKRVVLGGREALSNSAESLVYYFLKPTDSGMPTALITLKRVESDRGIMYSLVDPIHFYYSYHAPHHNNDTTANTVTLNFDFVKSDGQLSVMRTRFEIHDNKFYNLVWPLSNDNASRVGILGTRGPTLNTQSTLMSAQSLFKGIHERMISAR